MDNVETSKPKMVTLLMKYWPGETVYYMKDNKVTSGMIEVLQSNLVITAANPKTEGGLSYRIRGIFMNEDILFPTREALLKTL